VSGAPGGNGTAPRESEPHVDVLPDAESAARAAATLLAGALADAARERGRADWATTGGSTVIPIYRHLTQSPLAGLVPWDRVHVWLGDDRCVVRDHPLSNRRPLEEVLLGGSGRTGVPLPAANLHPIPMDQAIADGSPETAAEAYEAELRAAPLRLDAGTGVPALDVVLVGVGPDGHVLSVFPGSPLLDSTAWVSAVPAPEHVEPRVARVSLSPRFLTAARLPIAVVLGEAKAEVVADVLAGPRDVRRLPAQLARRTGAAWFLDEAAATELRRRTGRP
jgi:6-phosphogluconolactonase